MTATFRTIFLLILAMLCIIYTNVSGWIEPVYAGTHFLIVVLALLHIMRMRRFNLGVSFSFFAMFFFGFIPLFEYKFHITYNGTFAPRDLSYSTAANLALISSVFFYLGYGFKRDIEQHADELVEITYFNRRHRRFLSVMAVVTVLALATSIAIYYGFDYSSLFFRGFAEELESSAFGYSFITFFVRPLLFNILFLVVMIRAQRAPGRDWVVYSLSVLIVLFISPLGIPRSLAGALYIPFLMLVFFPRMTSKYGILCAIVFAVLLAAPIFDVFRVLQLKEGLDLVSNFSFDYLFAGHFDAFYNLAQVVDLNYSSNGWQTIGALLFWVPRAIWPGKPIGTSFEFADFAGLRSGNVSFPLTADLYVDYGVAGVILGMFFLGLIYRRLDTILAKPQKRGSLSSYVFAIAHLEMSILGIYLLRGNFLSSLAFTVGVATTLMVILIANTAIRSIQRLKLQVPPTFVRRA